MSWAKACPSPFSVGPKSSFLLKFGWRGCRISSNHQPTNGIYLVVKGLAVSMVRVTGLTTHRSMATCVPTEMASVSTPFLPPPPNVCFLSDWDGVLRAPVRSHCDLSPCLAVWRAACGGRGGQGAVPAVWKYLPRVDPALMFF